MRVLLGKIEAGFSRAKFIGGAENRGGESTLGNKVAEVQRWATDADIAFMNPGGLRADMLGTGTDYPRTVTYKNAADVQPFANTLMTMDLTGASLKKVLEQQWQRNGRRQPSRRVRSSSWGSRTGSSTPTTRLVPRATGSPGCGSTA